VKIKPIACLLASVIVGALLAGWFLRGDSPPAVVPFENQLAPSQEDEVARRERVEQQRMERERRTTECREALSRTARAFLVEAIAMADRSEYEISCGNRLWKITEMQVQAGDFVDARTTALAIKDTAAAAKLLPKVIRAQFDAGEPVEARETFRIWFDIMQARNKDATGKQEWRRTVAGVQSDLGDRDAATAMLRSALPLVRKIKNTYDRSSDLTDLADAQAEVGDVAGVRETMAVHESVKYKKYTLRLVAKAQIRAGDFAGAQAAVATMTGANVELRAEIITAQVRAGDIAGAVAAAEAGKDWRQDRAWTHIALEQCRAGDLAAADATQAKIKFPARRDGVLAAITAARIEARDFSGAGATAATIGHAARRAEAYRLIAIAQGTAEAFAVAREVAVAVEHAGARASVCLALAKAQVAAGDHTGLVLLLEVVELGAAKIDASDNHFTQFRSDLARMFVTAGNVPAAMKTLREAVDLAKTIQYRDARREVLGKLQAEIGDFAGALATLAVIESAGDRRRLLLKIAEVKLAAGDVAGVAKMIDDTLAPVERDELRARIAGKQAQLGDMTAASATVAEIVTPGLVGTAYRCIAMAQAEACNGVGAMATLEKIEHLQMRGNAGMAVAIALAEAGDFPAARAAALKTHGIFQRAQAFQSIARVCGERGDAASVLAWARQEQEAFCGVMILMGGAEGLRTMAKSAEPSFVPQTTTPPNIVPALPIPTQ